MSQQQQQAIASPVAWLTTVASRICLDLLGSARARREAYVGEWLPEPLPDPGEWPGGRPGAAADPADRITLDESVSMAFLVVVDSLTRAQRVAFILHDASCPGPVIRAGETTRASRLGGTMNSAGSAPVTQELPADVAGGWRRHERVMPAETNDKKRRAVSLWRAFWLYLTVTWLAAGALIELQPLTHVPGQVLELVQFAPSIAVLRVLARYRAAVPRIWQGTAVVMLRRIAVGAGSWPGCPA